jgi:hypothetical protein
VKTFLSLESKKNRVVPVHTITAYEGLEVQVYSFLISALNVVSCTGRFTPGEGFAWVGGRTVLDALTKK